MSKYPDLVQRLREVNWVCAIYGKTEIKHDTVCHEAADAIEALDKRIVEIEEAYVRLSDKELRQRERIAELEDAFREIYEVYAGSDGFIPETCAEGYQQQLIKEMADIAARHMRKGVKE